MTVARCILIGHGGPPWAIGTCSGSRVDWERL